MTVGDPRRALASLQPLDEYRSVEHVRLILVFRCLGTLLGTIRYQALAELNGQADFGETPAGEGWCIVDDEAGLGRTSRRAGMVDVFLEDRHGILYPEPQPSCGPRSGKCKTANGWAFGPVEAGVVAGTDRPACVGLLALS